MEKLPLFSALKNYQKEDFSSFHTPGHKNKILNHDLIDFDYTELLETDSLFESSGPILKLEQNLAKVFQAKHTLLSAGGCSLCIQTMLRLALPQGGKIIISRMVHKSAVNAMALLNIDPVWVMPKVENRTNLLQSLTGKDIEKAILKNPDAKAVYITSPDYYGVLANIKEISKVCKKYSLSLLVDNAHGSHLAFLQNNQHPLFLGADICADSLHKTLQVLTGGAALHLAGEKYILNAKQSMALFGSTSPSYPIMASVDLCCDWLNLCGKTEFIKLEHKVKEIKNLAKRKGFVIAEKNVDPTRIVLNARHIGFTGEELFWHFKKFKVEPEFFDGNFVVLIPTPFNTDKDFERLTKALISLEAQCEKASEQIFIKEPKQAVSLSKALFLPSRKIETKNAANFVCAETVCHCPPGIPALVPGEVIDSKTVDFLLHYGIFSINVLK